MVTPLYRRYKFPNKRAISGMIMFESGIDHIHASLPVKGKL